MRTKIGFIGVLILAAGLYLFWPRTFTVVLESDGFHPGKITVPAGSVVVFKNRSGRAFWPASNFHPSHKLYAEFDAKESIQEGNKWQFTFIHPGIWRYHDHLDSQKGGIITVRNTPWAKKRACQNEVCFIQEIEHVLVKKGLDGALERFGRLYENVPEFSSSCHDVTHLLGEAAYREFARGGNVITTEKTAYCGYGFYHGFIEALLFTTGNFDQAKNYCRAVQQKLSETIASPNAIYSCYHGLGHGTFDTQSFSAWGDDRGMLTSALTTCERVTMGEEAELVKQCATGVFNALANAYNNETYNLRFDVKNPWGICLRQENIEYKKACFREVAASYIKRVNISEESAIAMIAHLTDRVGANATVYAYMSEEARLHLAAPLSSWAKTCQEISRSDLQISCTQGVATGLFLWGSPGSEHVKAIAFCGSSGLSKNNREACFAYVLPRIRSVYNREKALAVCQTMDPAYQPYCL